jgi:hypothetical protein
MRMRSCSSRTIVAVALAIALMGCWPWHKKESQQQKFMDALNRGNGAEANQIWLGMDAESRAAFAHSEGMHANVPPDEIKNKITRHYMEKMGIKDESETVEEPTPNVHLGGLESLPEYVGPSGAPPQAVTVPPKTAPSD